MDKFFPQIKKIVLVMFENRSFDNLVGWLYSSEDPPKYFIPDNTGSVYNGLEENKYSLPLKGYRPFPVIKGTCGNGTTVPSKDPHEEYKSVNNQLFGTEVEWPKKKTPTKKSDGTPKMKGFLQDYNSSFESWDQALQITQTYTPSLLPVINGLAKGFAVCDEWYSSVPTQTNPNRAFFHCGTSLGRESNQTITAVETFDTDTIWNLLPKNVSWAIYYHDTWPITNPLSKKCYTQYTFPNIDKVAGGNNFYVIDKFFEDAKNGNLPDFVFLEPKWGFGYDERISRPGNDYHPPLNVKDGELFLKQIYDSLRAGKDWDDTLLIITFDEHGGTWDHMSPPWGATPPDSHKGETGFKFDRFGVRVPTILVSPWIEQGTVFRSEDNFPYDHTSIISTILTWAWKSDIWSNDKNVGKKTGLGNRVHSAPIFENVLTRTMPRTDKVEVLLPPDVKGRAITICNETNTKLYYYFGYKTGLTELVVPKYKGYLKRGETVTYDTSQKDTFSWDYFVNASYWVGDGIQKPGEHIDHGYTGLTDQWRLFWPDWELMLHHQKLVFHSFPFKEKWTGDDKYGGKSQIRIKNESYTKLYYHLHYTSKHAGIVGGQYKGELHRGEEFSYPTGKKDTTAWEYTVDISYWVGDSDKKAGERIDSDWGVDKEWRFIWNKAKAIEHNQTVTIFQDSSEHPTALIGC